ncbi:hypothetical protein DVA76_16810 [Acinetobacter baumannii]|nr:hypothetical protein [Microbacterium sp. C7(2022)]RCU35220.1 hypothetical protein DVA81_17410 [Acinetobacter baumannii]RCU38833.1 hypothetical protein DVA76_16810 [Acinetobacter baumannii]
MVTPIEFVLKNDRQTVVYIPILKMLQTLLNNGEILDKAMSSETNLSQGYRSHRDGYRFKDNSLLTEEEFRIALFLYIDDFEVAKPLGTSRKKHKLPSTGYLEIYTLNIAPLFIPFSLLYSSSLKMISGS